MVVTACPSGPGPDARACEEMQARLVADLPAGSAPRVTSLVRRGDPVEVLTRVAGERDLLVAGTRGRGRLRSLLLGSTAQGCAERARCPVVIIPAAGRTAEPADGALRPVVAGVDASLAATQALHFAAEEARLRGVPLVAVHIVYPDYLPGPRPALGRTDSGDLLDPLDSAQAQLEALIRSEFGGQDLSVQPAAVSGQPDRVLLDWSDAADLVVVGTRGVGRIYTALLGTVSVSLLTRARSPVAVVPSPPRPATTG